jgi:DNA-binding NarL/FixJ family response regulator
MKKRILLIEKSPIVAAGFTEILQKRATFEVTGVADSLNRITERIIVDRPDLIVINPILIDYSKRNTFRSLFQDSPKIPIVALVYSYFDQQWLKSFNGVIEINEEEAKIDSLLNDALQSNVEQSENTDLYELSDREREVLVELSKGLTNKEIAEKLHISVHTAITHRKNIIKKTGIKSVAGLTVYAMLNNLIE